MNEFQCEVKRATEKDPEVRQEAALTPQGNSVMNALRTPGLAGRQLPMTRTGRSSCSARAKATRQAVQHWQLFPRAAPLCFRPSLTSAPWLWQDPAHALKHCVQSSVAKMCATDVWDGQRDPKLESTGTPTQASSFKAPRKTRILNCRSPGGPCLTPSN